MDKRINDIVIDTGIQPHFLGYVFTVKGIELILEDYFRVFNLTRDVYTPIAKEYHTTTTRVERDIRNAIEAAFTRNSIEVNDRYFKYLNINKGKPTNKEYLAIIANTLINGK